MRFRRPVATVLLLALIGVGLVGAYRYWESYYRNRGFATVAYLPHAGRGRLETVHFYSPALRRRSDYLVYLPPGYGIARRRYPVYYLLHGSPGRPQVYVDIAGLPVRMDNLISRRRMRPMILVFCDGRIDGSTYSDSEWANTPAGRYDASVIDVVHDVDRRFATLADRRDRVIAGFSAGAYGATNVALHHLGTFAGLQSWSGYYRETRTGVFAHVATATLRANSPADYVSRLRRQLAIDPLRAFLFIGRDDNSSPQTAPMAHALAAAGASLTYALYPGGHDWQLWHAHLNQMLVLASRDTSRPLPARERARFLTPGVVPIPHGLGHLKRPGSLGGQRAHRSHRHAARLPRHSARPDRHRYRRRHRHRRRARPVAATITLGRLTGGLLLAIVSAALINLGFLLQHRGLRGRLPETARARLRAAFSNRTWLAGQAIGWTGFIAQIVAVAIAPLALVQAFAAGGLALSVPLAAGLFAHRVTRVQMGAVLAMAIALAILPLGASAGRDRLSVTALVGATAVAVALAAMLSRVTGAWIRAVAAGLLYGVADAAVKGVSLGWHAHGPGALLSGWTALAAAATFGGFLAFQSALRGDGAVSSISLMTAFSAITGVACGLLAFGESLGAGTPVVTVHVAAIAVVLGCVPVLAAAQEAIAAHDDRGVLPTTPAAPAGAGS